MKENRKSTCQKYRIFDIIRQIKINERKKEKHGRIRFKRITKYILE